MLRQSLTIHRILLFDISLVEPFIVPSLCITIHIGVPFANVCLNGRHGAVLQPRNLFCGVWFRDGRVYGCVEIAVCPGSVAGLVRPGAVVGAAVVEEAWSVEGHCYFWIWVGRLVGSLILYRDGEMEGLMRMLWRKFINPKSLKETFIMCEIRRYSRSRRNNIEQVDKK
jgi:hypothetical protein